MRLLDLIKNENMKLYRHRTIYIFLTITNLLPILLILIQNFTGEIPFSSFWEITLYAVQNHILFSLILTILITTQTITDEFSKGTIKFLLIRPASRSKILLSKYIAVWLFSLLSFFISILFGFVTAAILSGLQGVDQLSSFFLFLGQIGIKLLIYPFYISVSVAIAITTRQFGLTLLITLFIFMFTVHFIPIIPGLSLIYSILIWFIFYIAFTFVGWSQFKQQDI